MKSELQFWLRMDVIGAALLSSLIGLARISSLLNVQVQLLLSALSQTRNTNTFEFSLAGDEWEGIDTWWKWITYALFFKRARACSAVENLELTCISSLQTRGMEILATAVVVAENPEEVLFDSSPGIVESE
ncbi:hypothetical protein P3T76_014341 [Phytophthora citrophthora]|uniref:Uncharacterized protein n=1 Tax=Phytophthora citrophthora TaxID=4793 RepID=A0AAD9G1C1_9STRA|nr:hypothetical protein P3T76_014341 [Phytophthora citrophthora]